MSSPSAQKKIGLITATIVGMNAMIGAGIFAVPAALSASVGPAGLITYAFVIVAIYFMGQSLARLAQLYPQEGSFYTYASKWGGHKMGVLSGGAYIIGLIIAMGLLTQIVGQYLHITFPFIAPKILGAICLVALVLLNVVGVHLSQIGQMILIFCTTLPIIITIIVCLTHGSFANYTPFMPYGLGNVFAATRAVIFGFFGFEAAASLFNVVKDPKKNVPKALIGAILIVGSLYMIFVASIIYAIPLKYLSADKPLTDTLAIVFPHHPWLLSIVNFSIISAIIGTIHSMIWSSSELLLAYFKKLRLPALSAAIASHKINQRTTVVLLGIAIAITFTTLKSIDLFFSFTAAFIIFAFSTSIITLLALEKNWKSWQSIKTIIGLITAAIIFYFAIEGIIANIR